MSKIENLKRLYCFFGYPMAEPMCIMFYDMHEKKLHKDVPCLFYQKELEGMEESKIKIFYETPDEITIYDHELNTIFYSNNLFLMQYKNSIIIFFMSVSDFITNLLEGHITVDIAIGYENEEEENEKEDY